MKRKSNKWAIWTAFIAAAVLGVVFLHGCGDKAQIAGPAADDYQPAMSAVSVLDSLLDVGAPKLAAESDLDYLKDSPYYLADAAAKLIVDENGGDLKIQLDNQEIVFHVPSGAVAQPVEIQIWGFKFRTPYGDAWLYDCSPDGLEFAVPIWVDHPVGRADGVWSVLVFFDDLTQSMTLEQVSPVLNGRAHFEISHFSKYGIS